MSSLTVAWSKEAKGVRRGKESTQQAWGTASFPPLVALPNYCPKGVQPPDLLISVLIDCWISFGQDFQAKPPLGTCPSPLPTAGLYAAPKQNPHHIPSGDTCPGYLVNLWVLVPMATQAFVSSWQSRTFFHHTSAVRNKLSEMGLDLQTGTQLLPAQHLSQAA